LIWERAVSFYIFAKFNFNSLPHSFFPPIILSPYKVGAGAGAVVGQNGVRPGSALIIEQSPGTIASFLLSFPLTLGVSTTQGVIGECCSNSKKM
jgi:hypothetical protein